MVVGRKGKKTQVSLGESPVGIIAHCGRLECASRAMYRCQDPRYRWPTTLYLCPDHLKELQALVNAP